MEDKNKIWLYRIKGTLYAIQSHIDGPKRMVLGAYYPQPENNSVYKALSRAAFYHATHNIKSKAIKQRLNTSMQCKPELEGIIEQMERAICTRSFDEDQIGVLDVAHMSEEQFSGYYHHLAKE